jgi:hypothetical protein
VRLPPLIKETAFGDVKTPRAWYQAKVGTLGNWTRPRIAPLELFRSRPRILALWYRAIFGRLFAGDFHSLIRLTGVFVDGAGDLDPFFAFSFIGNLLTDYFPLTFTWRTLPSALGGSDECARIVPGCGAVGGDTPGGGWRRWRRSALKNSDEVVIQIVR